MCVAEYVYPCASTSVHKGQSVCVKLHEVCGSNYSSQFRKKAHVRFCGCSLEPISTDLPHGLDLWAGRPVLWIMVHL